MSIKSAIQFAMGERWHGWPVERVEPVPLREGDEGMWFIAPGQLELKSMQVHLLHPLDKGNVTFSLERCRWDGSRLMKLKDWLGRRLRFLRFLSPWKRLSLTTVASEPVRYEWPKPIPISPGDCLRVVIRGVGSGAGPGSDVGVTGGSLRVSVLTECG